MTRSRWCMLSLISGVLGIAACATGSGRSAPAPRDVLLADEIQGTSAVTAYDAVRQLRPEWLRRRGRSSIQNPRAEVLVVYLDGVRFGGPEALRTITIGGVREIRYLDANDATTRFGTGHAGGALLIQTK